MLTLVRLVTAVALGVTAFVEVVAFSISSGPVVWVVAPGHGVHVSDVVAVAFGLLMAGGLSMIWLVIWVRQMRREQR
jgi:hypothetical protein